MATTVTAPVNNQIALAADYVPFLDEKYITESRTALLDTANEFVRFTGANTVNLFSIEAVGMSNYDRNAGFVPGDLTGTWQPYVLETDRGRSYQIDYLDNDEVKGVLAPSVLGYVERQYIIPEVDAFRFAQYASAASVGDGNRVNETLTAGAATVASIDLATAAMDDAEVPYEGRILFVNPTTYRLLKGGITRMVMNRENDVNYNVEMYNDMRVITVPGKRFHTQITLNAPTTSNGAGGYTAGGQAINYMIVHPSAVMQVMKHYVPRLFAPEQNTQADAWLCQPRFAHGAWVLNSKKQGIFVSAPAPAGG